jgi:hypothetical protein
VQFSISSLYVKKPTTAVNTVENLQMHEYVLIHGATYINKGYVQLLLALSVYHYRLGNFGHTISAPRCQRQHGKIYPEKFSAEVKQQKQKQVVDPKMIEAMSVCTPDFMILRGYCRN